MPIVTQPAQAALGIGRGLNAYSLRELVKRRYPGLDDSEYLSEINAAYKEVWEELMQIDELFFSDIQVITVSVQGDKFDLLTNIYANLNTPIPRLHQIHCIRVQFPGGVYDAAHPTHLNGESWLTTRRLTDPYAGHPVLYVPFGEGSILFARPLPVGTLIEVFFTYGLLDMQILTDGTIASTGTTVTGTDSKFTSLTPLEMGGVLPSTGAPTESQLAAEIIANGKIYRVTSITTDTLLATERSITPAASTSAYILASVPEIPAYEHRVIADIATRNILSTPGDDDRVGLWVGLASKAIDRMKATLMERQRQANPKKVAFRGSRQGL